MSRNAIAIDDTAIIAEPPSNSVLGKRERCSIDLEVNQSHNDTNDTTRELFAKSLRKLFLTKQRMHSVTRNLIMPPNSDDVNIIEFNKYLKSQGFVFLRAFVAGKFKEFIRNLHTMICKSSSTANNPNNSVTISFENNTATVCCTDNTNITMVQANLECLLLFHDNGTNDIDNSNNINHNNNNNTNSQVRIDLAKLLESPVVNNSAGSNRLTGQSSAIDNSDDTFIFISMMDMSNVMMKNNDQRYIHQTFTSQLASEFIQLQSISICDSVVSLTDRGSSSSSMTKRGQAIGSNISILKLTLETIDDDDNNNNGTTVNSCESSDLPKKGYYDLSTKFYDYIFNVDKDVLSKIVKTANSKSQKITISIIRQGNCYEILFISKNTSTEMYISQYYELMDSFVISGNTADNGKESRILQYKNDPFENIDNLDHNSYDNDYDNGDNNDMYSEVFKEFYSVSYLKNFISTIPYGVRNCIMRVNSDYGYLLMEVKTPVQLSEHIHTIYTDKKCVKSSKKSIDDECMSDNSNIADELSISDVNDIFQHDWCVDMLMNPTRLNTDTNFVKLVIPSFVDDN